MSKLYKAKDKSTSCGVDMLCAIGQELLVNSSEQEAASEHRSCAYLGYTQAGARLSQVDGSYELEFIDSNGGFEWILKCSSVRKPSENVLVRVKTQSVKAALKVDTENIMARLIVEAFGGDMERLLEYKKNRLAVEHMVATYRGVIEQPGVVLDRIWSPWSHKRAQSFCLELRASGGAIRIVHNEQEYASISLPDWQELWSGKGRPLYEVFTLAYKFGLPKKLVADCCGELMTIYPMAFVRAEARVLEEAAKKTAKEPVRGEGKKLRV